MSKAQARIQVRVDQDIKEQSEEILDKIGISMSDLINMTLRRVVYERRIPFDTEVLGDSLPECMQVKTEAELIARLKEATEYNLEHPETCTIDELEQRLSERYGLQV